MRQGVPTKAKGVKSIKLLLLAFGLALSGVSAAATPPGEDYCQAFKELEDHTNRLVPIRGQGSLDLLQLKISCPTKTVLYKRRLNSLVTTVSGAWREQQQKEHTQRHCDKNGIAYRYEWYARDEIYNKDGKWLATLTTKPRDCAKEETKQ